MKLSELMGKEIVNIYNGVRLGSIGDSDLIIDAETGDIDSIILPSRGSFVSFFRETKNLEIPWESVKKVGSEVVIVELDKETGFQRRFF